VLWAFIKIIWSWVEIVSFGKVRLFFRKYTMKKRVMLKVKVIGYRALNIHQGAISLGHISYVKVKVIGYGALMTASSRRHKPWAYFCIWK
jgi:hypothetical protein